LIVDRPATVDVCRTMHRYPILAACREPPRVSVFV